MAALRLQAGGRERSRPRSHGYAGGSVGPYGRLSLDRPASQRVGEARATAKRRGQSCGMGRPSGHRGGTSARAHLGEHQADLDLAGGIFLAGGRECKMVTGIDDHSRYVVIAQVLAVPNRRSAATSCRSHRYPSRLPSLRSLCRHSQVSAGAVEFDTVIAVCAVLGQLPW